MADHEALVDQNSGREYEPEAYIAQQVLGLDPNFAHDCRHGLHLIYLRDYRPRGSSSLRSAKNTRAGASVP